MCIACKMAWPYLVLLPAAAGPTLSVEMRRWEQRHICLCGACLCGVVLLFSATAKTYPCSCVFVVWFEPRILLKTACIAAFMWQPGMA
jgi:hypothetical protein